MEITHINPDTMAMPRGYSHAISVAGTYKTIYIGGQNAIDAHGTLVGKNSLKKQTGQALTNIEKILATAGSKPENLVKLTVHIVQGQNPRDGFEAFQERWPGPGPFPTVTVVFVAGLGDPDWLVEIDAVAVAPE